LLRVDEEAGADESVRKVEDFKAVLDTKPRHTCIAMGGTART